MDVYEIIESILDSNNDDGIVGRTTLYKLVYLSEKSIDGLAQSSYQSHYYGPHCPEHTASLINLISNSFVYEIVAPGGMYEGYEYHLTKDGQQITSGIKTKFQNEYDQINSLVSLCKKSCNLKTATLSYAVKLDFLLEKNPDKEKQIDYNTAASLVDNPSWDISSDDVECAMKILKELDLVNIIKN